MSSSTLAVNFAFADGTIKLYSLGPFATNSVAVSQFKTRLRNFNSVDETSQKKYTNLYDVLKSENGADSAGILTADIIESMKVTLDL